MRNSDKKVITQRTTEKTQRVTEGFSGFRYLAYFSFLCHSVTLSLFFAISLFRVTRHDFPMNQLLNKSKNKPRFFTFFSTGRSESSLNW